MIEDRVNLVLLPKLPMNIISLMIFFTVIEKKRAKPSKKHCASHKEAPELFGTPPNQLFEEKCGIRFAYGKN